MRMHYRRAGGFCFFGICGVCCDCGGLYMIMAAVMSHPAPHGHGKKFLRNATVDGSRLVFRGTLLP